MTDEEWFAQRIQSVEATLRNSRRVHRYPEDELQHLLDELADLRFKRGVLVRLESIALRLDKGL